MEALVKKNLKRAIGIFLIIFGICGIILPILPGWWVGVIGLELLGWRLVFDRKKPWSQIITLLDKNKEKLKVE